MYTLYVLFFALVVDRAVGDPENAWRRVPHPVVLFGRAVGFFEKHFNRKGLNDRDRRAYGMMAILALLIFGTVLGVRLHHTGVAHLDQILFTETQAFFQNLHERQTPMRWNDR